MDTSEKLPWIMATQDKNIVFVEYSDLTTNVPAMKGTFNLGHHTMFDHSTLLHVTQLSDVYK